MEQAQKEDNNGIASVEVSEVSPALAPARSVASSGNSQAGVPGCPTCGAVAGVQEAAIATNPYIYALGQIETRFPRPSVEKEMAQATGRAATAGHTDHRAFYEVLSKRENRYLARQMCWVLSIQGLETYILQPRDPADLDLLINATQPQPTPWISTVIGIRGPVAPPSFATASWYPSLRSTRSIASPVMHSSRRFLGRRGFRRSNLSQPPASCSTGSCRLPTMPATKTSTVH